MTRNRSRSLLTVVLLLGTLAFTGTDAAASGAEVQRPLKVSLDFVGVDPDPGFDVCVGPNQEPAGSEGTGRLSHLGRVQISGNQCNNFVDLEVTDGFGTYVAANGDYIEVEFSGSAVFNPVGPVLDGWGSAEIVGGTGRFEAASGEFDFTFTTFLSDGSTVLDGDGWISYDASDRRNA